MKKYTGLTNNNDIEKLDELIDCLYDGGDGEVGIDDIEKLDELIDCLYDGGDGEVGIDEIVKVVCGKKFYGKWDEEDLEYVKELMREMRGIEVDFNLYNESMYVIGEVEE